jgi:hypothetical protein
MDFSLHIIEWNISKSFKEKDSGRTPQLIEEIKEICFPVCGQGKDQTYCLNDYQAIGGLLYQNSPSQSIPSR